MMEHRKKGGGEPIFSAPFPTSYAPPGDQITKHSMFASDTVPEYFVVGRVSGQMGNLITKGT